MNKLPEKRSAEATEEVKRSRKTESPPDHMDYIGEEGSSLVPHPTIEGLFIGNGTLYTRNLVPGEAHIDEILLLVKNDDDGTQVEYREWNPCTSKLAAAIVSGADNILIKPGSLVLYLGLGDECGTTVSHISDLVGPDGLVYVMEKENWKALVRMADKRINIVPIIYSPSPSFAVKYHMLVSMVDVMFAAVADDHQARLTNKNAQLYLKTNGQYVISVKANCMNPTGQTEAVFTCLAKERQRQFKPMKQVTLKPFDKDHAYIIGFFRRPLDSALRGCTRAPGGSG